jgi:hypothetical protein
MNLLFAATFFAATVTMVTIEDVKVALMAMAVMLIPSVGILIKAAIDNQTIKLLNHRQRHRRSDPSTEEAPE